MLLRVRLSLNWASCVTEHAGETLDEATQGREIRATPCYQAERLEAPRLKTDRLKVERLETERLETERLEAQPTNPAGIEQIGSTLRVTRPTTF